jgi:hypothetical protein
MSSLTPQSAQDDLAFLRALVRTSDEFQLPFGEAYLAAGLCYGVQMVLSAGQTLGWISNGPAPGLMIGFGPTIIFAVLMTIIVIRNRSTAPAGLMGRAIAAVFGTMGLANLALVAVVGSVAWREHSLTVWLIYPCTVFVLQGAAWFIAFSLRFRLWLAAVASGWLFFGLLMAWFITQPVWFTVVGGVGMIVCMVVPGAVMVRLARGAGA